MGMEEYKTLVGGCAMVTTMVHMLTGTLVCKDIYKKGTAKGFDPMPFIGGIGMCIINMQYGFLLSDPAMINVNVFGVVTNVLYMAIYYLYSPDKSQVMTTLGKATLFVALVLGYAQVENKDLIEFRYGVLTTTLMFILIGSPLINLGEIIRTKSTEILPFPLIFMGTLVSFQWLLYGLIIDNPFVIFQNGVGFALSLSQLSLFAIYPSTPAAKKGESTKKID